MSAGAWIEPGLITSARQIGRPLKMFNVSCRGRSGEGGKVGRTGVEKEDTGKKIDKWKWV